VPPFVSKAGRALCAHFPGEVEVALFIPGPADVVRSTLSAWQVVTASHSGLEAHNQGLVFSNDGDLDDLGVVLTRLGAFV